MKKISSFFEFVRSAYRSLDRKDPMCAVNDDLYLSSVAKQLRHRW